MAEELLHIFLTDEFPFYMQTKIVIEINENALETEADLKAQINEMIANLNSNSNEKDLEGPESIPTLKDTREILAISFGWQSWDEMIDAVSVPHEPAYIDDDHEALVILSSRMSPFLGFDYHNGIVLNIIENLGLGFSQKRRREMAETATPWGQIIESTTLAEGIDKVQTSSHGGFVLSEKRCLEIPQHLSLGKRFYEEDCEANLIYLAFPEISEDKLAFTLAFFDLFDGDSIPYVMTDWDRKREEERSLGRNYHPIHNPFIPRDEALNRELNTEEKQVTEYLAKCILNNKLPIRMPDIESPTLQDWVTCLSKILNVDGKWPMSNKKWREHFWLEI